MNEITTTVFGYVAAAPRHLVTRSGAAVTSFRLASTPHRFDPAVQGFVEGETTWLTVTCWRGLAFNAAQSLQKGQPVIVHGTLSVRDWEQDGRTGREVEVDALAVGHDLRRGRATFERVTRPVADRTTVVPGADTAGPGGAGSATSSSTATVDEPGTDDAVTGAADDAAGHAAGHAAGDAAGDVSRGAAA